MRNEAVAGWIAGILAAKDWLPTDLARHAGLAPSTVIRIADPDYPFAPRLRTLRLISEASLTPIPDGVLGVSSRRDRRVFEAPAAVDPSTVPMRSFGHMPARLSPVKRGEVRIERPKGVEGDAFAFFPHDDRLAPAVRTNDLLFARSSATPVYGDLVVLITAEGLGHLGYLAGGDEASYALDLCGGVGERIPVGDVVEVATIILLDRNGPARRIVWDRPEETTTGAAA